MGLSLCAGDMQLSGKLYMSQSGQPTQNVLYKHTHANSTNHASMKVADINEVLVSAAVSFTTGLLCP